MWRIKFDGIATYIDRPRLTAAYFSRKGIVRLAETTNSNRKQSDTTPIWNHFSAQDLIQKQRIKQNTEQSDYNLSSNIRNNLVYFTCHALQAQEIQAVIYTIFVLFSLVKKR